MLADFILFYEKPFLFILDHTCAYEPKHQKWIQLLWKVTLNAPHAKKNQSFLNENHWSVCWEEALVYPASRYVCHLDRKCNRPNIRDRAVNSYWIRVAIWIIDACISMLTVTSVPGLQKQEGVVTLVKKINIVIQQLSMHNNIHQLCLTRPSEVSPSRYLHFVCRGPSWPLFRICTCCFATDILSNVVSNWDRGLQRMRSLANIVVIRMSYPGSQWTVRTWFSLCFRTQDFMKCHANLIPCWAWTAKRQR